MPKKKIIFASTVSIEELRTDVDKVLWHIASFLKEETDSEEDWLQYCFVSDESRIGDFLSDQVELALLRAKLQLPDLQMGDYIYKAASALRDKESHRQVRMM